MFPFSLLMKPLEVIAFTIALLKAGYGVEKIIYELAQREEKGIFVKIVKAIKRGMELPEALERASNLEKGIMKEYFSMLAKVARGELGEIEPRLKEMLHYGYEEERRVLRKSMKRFSMYSSALIVSALSFAIIGSLASIIASIPLGPFSGLFKGVDLIALASLPTGLIAMFIITLLGWREARK